MPSRKTSARRFWAEQAERLKLETSSARSAASRPLVRQRDAGGEDRYAVSPSCCIAHRELTAADLKDRRRASCLDRDDPPPGFGLGRRRRPLAAARRDWGEPT